VSWIRAIYAGELERGAAQSGAHRTLGCDDDVRTVEHSPLYEIARVLVRFNHVASVIVNVNHSIM
jgi:hypothetical protein